MNGRHAATGGYAKPLAHRVDELVVGHPQVAVPELPCGLLAENAGRRAALVALDDTSFHFELAAGQSERRGVEPERVVVVGEERRRYLARHGVERLLRRFARPLGVAPAETADDVAHRAGAAHALERLLKRRRALETYLTQRERPGWKVHVRVGEAGQDAAAAEIDDVRARQRRLVGADPAGDGLARNGERALSRQAGVHCADGAVLEDHGSDSSREEE